MFNTKTKIIKPQRRVQELEKIQTICRTSLQTRNLAAIPCVLRHFPKIITIE